MQVVLPLEHMSIEEKLAAIEMIWTSLAQHPDDTPSPAWHEALLEDRERSATKGSSQFLELAEAKKVVREKLL